MIVFDPGLIVVQAALTGTDSRAVEALVGDVLRLAHAEESAIRISPAENVFGWNFYTLSVDKEVAIQLAQLSESGMLDFRGESLEQKFVDWLNGRTQAENAGDRLHFSLLSDLKSSRYGLF